MWKISEWDETQPRDDGTSGFIFELIHLDSLTREYQGTVFVIRRADGTYEHMDNTFRRIDERLSEASKSAREIAVAQYMSAHI